MRWACSPRSRSPNREWCATTCASAKRAGPWPSPSTRLAPVVTALVTVILAVEKFTEGAWIVLVAIPVLICCFRTVKRHYVSIGKQLALEEGFHFPVPQHHKVLVLVSALGKGTIPALEYARAMSPEAEAVHVELNPEATSRLRQNWEQWGTRHAVGDPASPFRSITEPLLEYFDQIDAEYGADAWVTIVIPNS